MDVTQITKTTLLLTAMAISSPLVSACYPRPHRYTSSPEISGVVRKSGVPVHGAKLLLAQTRGDDGNYCRGARVVAVSMEDGRFKVAANTELLLFTSLLNPPNTVAQITSVCFEIPAQQKLGVLLMASTDREASFELCRLQDKLLESFYS